jgi:predicted nucleotidyltransferase
VAEDSGEDRAAGVEGAVTVADLGDLEEEAAVAEARVGVGDGGAEMADNERKLTELVGRLKEAAHANLEAVILYGSAARGDFHEVHSDLNVLCVMGSLAVDELKRVGHVVKWWTEDLKEPAPLLFTEKELRASADVFAVELIDIQRDHRVLFGKNFLKEIEVPTNLHRVQVEHELRTTLLKLRQHYVLAGGDARELGNVMVRSISSVKTLLRHVLMVFEGDTPRGAKEIFERIAKTTGAEAKAFEHIVELREKGGAHGAHENFGQEYGAYLRALEQVTEALDQFAPKREWQRVAKGNS